MAKRYVAEAGAARVEAAFAAGHVAISRLSLVEVGSALCRRSREGSLTTADRDRLLEALAADESGMLMVELTKSVVTTATALLRRYELRAADAIQLASCLELAGGLEKRPGLLAFDDRLQRAADAEGFSPYEATPRA